MRVAIAGAGNVGRAIAKELLEKGHQVILIEREPAAFKTSSVPEAEWVLADACETEALVDVGLDHRAGARLVARVSPRLRAG